MSNEETPNQEESDETECECVQYEKENAFIQQSLSSWKETLSLQGLNRAVGEALKLRFKNAGEGFSSSVLGSFGSDGREEDGHCSACFLRCEEKGLKQGEARPDGDNLCDLHAVLWLADAADWEVCAREPLELKTVRTLQTLLKRLKRKWSFRNYVNETEREVKR